MALPDRLRLIQFRAAYNLPVHAAAEQGIFARHGLEVEVTYTPGSDFLIEALESGGFEIGHPAADDVVAAVERTSGDRSDLFLFMGLHGGLMALVAAPEYPDVPSLRGRVLGVDSRVTGFVFLLERFLRSRGFSPGDYELVEVGGWEHRYRALLDRKIAAALLTAPYVDDALAAGCHLLARGGELSSVYQATCGAARRSWAKAHEALLVRYIRAYVEATRWCFAPRNRRACTRLLQKHHGLDPARAENTLKALLDPAAGIYPDAALNLPGIASVLELRAEMGRMAPPLPAVEKYVDLSYRRKALRTPPDTDRGSGGRAS
ncbi:MAG TPA: ABC transporter substrate-binding protein [candidate division Zixibacteria bacterium]|nr:ABC transporter substrate-binding protein [candidate division Zixibacteria bacterium]